MIVRRQRDDPAEPRFISRQALGDPATATELAFKEHLDVLNGLATGLDGVRHDRQTATAKPREWVAIGRMLREFLEALTDRAEDESVRRRTGSLQRLHNLVVDIQPQVRRLADNMARSGAILPSPSRCR